MTKRPPKKKNPAQKIQITEADGAKKVIGKYDPNKNLFTCDRTKSEHLLRKWNSWGLDQKVVEFLATKGATIRLKDKETKWEYECKAVDLVTYGRVQEFNQHRPQLFLSVDQWGIVTAKNRSCVIECLEKDCVHNFSNNCMRGVIRIGTNGECNGYEDRQET